MIIFKHFPKKRPKLSQKYKKIHKQYYEMNRKGDSLATGASKKMEQWMHKRVANDAINRKSNDAITKESNDKTELRTLEIGAGTLNHLPFERFIKNYDIVEPYVDLYKNSLFLHRINNIYKDISEIDHGKKYDRIISIATFEHICDLPELMARLSLLLDSKGVLQVAVPSEGTILWKLGWMLTTGLELKITTGLNYSVLNRYEHVNTASEIETVLNYFFKNVECRVYGLSKALSFYQYFKCFDPIFSTNHQQL